VVDLVDRDALKEYAQHPAHLDVIKKAILPIIETDGILAMDIEA
jgi:hypothetical protein